MKGLTRTGVALLVLSASLWGCGGTELTPDQIVPAFIAASQAETRQMHMEWHGTVTSPVGIDVALENKPINGSFELSGSDYAGHMEVAIPGAGDNDNSYARVGGATYVKYANSGWQRADGFGDIPTEFDPLHGLQEAGMVYEAADTLDGRPVHRLRVLNPLAAISGSIFDQAVFMGATVELNGPSEYMVYVDSQGIPVAAHVAIDIRLSTEPGSGGEMVPYQYTSDYQFTLWGEPVTISAPQLSNNRGGIKDGPPPQIQPNF
ncbi:MAG: hypothetical protein ABI452_00365 [Candidatus Limnocylindrales bacterium]